MSFRDDDQLGSVFGLHSRSDSKLSITERETVVDGDRYFTSS